MSYQNPNDGFENSAIFNNEGPTTLLERFGYVKQLVFSRTKLEFRLLWNKIFQKEDDELGWLLNPYKQSRGHPNDEATMMASFNKNIDNSYQYDYEEVGSHFGRERVTIYNRGIVRKGTDRRKAKKSSSAEGKKSFSDNALDIARYMGMGVYMTSASFPSPFYPVNDSHLYYDETVYNGSQSLYMSKIW